MSVNTLPPPSLNYVREHLRGKLEEWLEFAAATKLRFRNLSEAEQAFKDWLWGTSTHEH